MNYVLYAAELIGTIAFAVSGAALAIQKRLDLFGILFLGVITALGGGTVRDLLLGHTPPRMFYNVQYVALAILSSFLMFLLAKKRGGGVLSSGVDSFMFNLSDALGLGIFAVIGTQAGMTDGYGDNAFFCIILGMTTGVGGGIIRDIMCTDIPFVLRKHIYAVAALVGSTIFYILVYLNIDITLSSLIGMAATVSLRLLARHYRWNLPRIESTEEAKVD